MRTFSKDPVLVASRRKQIAIRAARLLVRKGYDRTSIREIAKACNMSMGMLYHYVGSKEDVLYLVMNHSIYHLSELCDEVFAPLDKVTATTALKRAIKGFFAALDEVQELVIFTYQETKNVNLGAQKSILSADVQLVQRFADLLTRGVRSGEFKIDNVMITAHAIVALGQMWSLNRWLLRKQCTLEQYTAAHTELIFEGIRASGR